MVSRCSVRATTRFAQGEIVDLEGLGWATCGRLDDPFQIG